MKYKVTRINDGKGWTTEEYKFLVFNEENRGKELVEKPIEGSALIIPPYTAFFTWMTSPITEVVNEYYFKTKNSEYKIEKL